MGSYILYMWVYRHVVMVSMLYYTPRLVQTYSGFLQLQPDAKYTKSSILHKMLLLVYFALESHFYQAHFRIKRLFSSFPMLKFLRKVPPEVNKLCSSIAENCEFRLHVYVQYIMFQYICATVHIYISTISACNRFIIPANIKISIILYPLAIQHCSFPLHLYPCTTILQ